MIGNGRLAIWNSESLVGQELKNTLAERSELWNEIRLLGPESDSALVSEVAGEAALVLPATEDNLHDLDLLFYCAQVGETVEIPEGLPETAATILLANDEPVPGVPMIVAGLNSVELMGESGGPTSLQSAHPATVLLAHLLGPLADLGLESCVASVVLPSSTRGQEGIDALLEETRAILAFQPATEESALGQQLAFNIAPSPDLGTSIASAVHEVLECEQLRVAVQSSLGGVFHSLLAGVFIQLATSTDAKDVSAALEASPAIQLASNPQTLSPVDAAASGSIMLGAVEATTTPGGFWLRAVMDNLTTGGALNAIGIAEAIFGADDGYTM